MANHGASGNGQAAADREAGPHVRRDILPIPDQQHVGLTTYDAKDPNTKYPPITMLRPPEGARPAAVLILFGEGPLSRVLTAYSRHYHSERNHQGKGDRLLIPDVSEKRYPTSCNIACRQRLGGLLRYYRRAA